MWSPSCLPDVVPSCCFPVRLLFSCLWPISHIWSLSCLLCCLPFLLFFSCLLPLSLIDVASQLSRIFGFLDAVFRLPPGFLHVLSSCLPPRNRPHIKTFDNPDLFPRIGLPIISTCLPFVALLFPSCLSDLSDVVPHLPPSCLALVLQIWSFPRLRVSSRCAFPILSQLFSTLPHNAQLSARFSPPIISHSFSLAFQIVSELPPRCGLPVVS